VTVGLSISESVALNGHREEWYAERVARSRVTADIILPVPRSATP
jgi:hypothetical protein